MKTRTPIVSPIGFLLKSPATFGRMQILKFRTTLFLFSVLIMILSPGGTTGDENEDTRHYCRYLQPPEGDKGVNGTTLAEFVEGNNLPKRLSWVMALSMEWSFQSNRTMTHHRSEAPHCYTFDVTLHFDNPDLDGTMAVELTSKVC